MKIFIKEHLLSKRRNKKRKDRNYKNNNYTYYRSSSSDPTQIKKIALHVFGSSDYVDYNSLIDM